MKSPETIKLDEIEEGGLRRHRISYVPPGSTDSTCAHILPPGASRDEAAEALEYMRHLLVTGAPFPRSLVETRSPSPTVTMNTRRVAALVFAVLAAISALKGSSVSETNTSSGKKPAIEAGVR